MSEFENSNPEQDRSSDRPLGYLVAASIREYSRRRTLKKMALVALVIVVVQVVYQIITGEKDGIFEFVSGIASFFLFYYVVRSILWWFRNRSFDGTVLGWFRDRSSAS
jgi:hypothetical protein